MKNTTLFDIMGRSFSLRCIFDLDFSRVLSHYIQKPTMRRFCMTKQQATAEMKYQLSKYILQVLLDKKLITTDEAIQAKAVLIEKYDPFTRCLEEVDVWQTGL